MNPHTNRQLYLFATLLLTVLFLPQGWALPTDKDQPATISADSAQVDHKAGITIFTGHVRVIQGSIVVRAAKLITYSNKAQKITKAIATGKPAHYHVLPKKGDNVFYASANKIVYFPTTGKVLLIQQGKLRQGKNTLTGPYIIYDKKKNLLISKPYAGKRTTITLVPQKKS